MRSRIRAMLKKLKHALGPVGYQTANLIYCLIPRFKPIIDASNFGVNFIGYSKGELGLGQAMRSMAFATREALIPFIVRQFNVRITSKQSNGALDTYTSNSCRYPINIICINPDMLYRLPYWITYSEWAKTYNIGYWFWELDSFPNSWRYALNMVDEIWVATEFIAEAIKKGGKNVVKIPFPLEFNYPPKHMDKKYFGLNPEKFTFIFSFDFLSSVERKNPMAIIRAFKMAFSEEDKSACLILKTVNGSHYVSAMENLYQLIDEDPRIKIWDEYLTQDEMRGLIRSCDCYISLHRAEGLGLGLAEAMYMGKVTIATSYSGNLEFMNSKNSILVPYELTDISSGQYTDAIGQRWAEPNLEFAANCMKKVTKNSVLVEVLSKQAALDMRKNHSYALVGRKINEELHKNFS